jgi:hypothetical protein
LLLHGRHTLYKVATLQAMGLLDTTTARNMALSPPGVRWMTLPRWGARPYGGMPQRIVTISVPASVLRMTGAG